MTELWQLYDEQGLPILGKGAAKVDIRKGILHGASHIWIWHQNSGEIEVLLQKRADDKPTWAGRYDISAAGHIDLGEDPLTAAVRETSEEIGLEVTNEQLRLASVFRAYMVESKTGIIENEFQWIYTFNAEDAAEVTLADGEVASVVWMLLSRLKQEIAVDSPTEQYVPHGKLYFSTVFDAIERHAVIGV